MKSLPRHHTAHLQGLRATSHLKSFSKVESTWYLWSDWAAKTMKTVSTFQSSQFFPFANPAIFFDITVPVQSRRFSLTPRCQTPDHVCVCCMLTFDGSLKPYPLTMCCYHQLRIPRSLQTPCTIWALYKANVCLSALLFCNATPKRIRQQSSAAWCLSLSRSPSKPNAQFNNAAAMIWCSGMRANNASLSLSNKASAAAKIRSFNGLFNDSFPRKHFKIHIWMLRCCLPLILYNFFFSSFQVHADVHCSHFWGSLPARMPARKLLQIPSGVCVRYFSSPESCCKYPTVFVFDNCFLQQCILRASCAWPSCSRSGEAWLEYKWIQFVNAKLKTPLNYLRLLGTFITAKLRTALAPMVT